MDWIKVGYAVYEKCGLGFDDKKKSIFSKTPSEYMADQIWQRNGCNARLSCIEVLEKFRPSNDKEYMLGYNLARFGGSVTRSKLIQYAEFLVENDNEAKNNALIYIELGKAYEADKRLKEASEIYLRLLELEPSWAIGIVAVARCMAKTEQFEEAFALLNKAKQSECYKAANSELPSIPIWGDESYEEYEDKWSNYHTVESNRCFKIDIDQMFEEITIRKAKCLERKYDFTNSLDTFLIAIDQSPANWEGYVGAARVFLKMGDYDKADEILEKATKSPAYVKSANTSSPDSTEIIEVPAYSKTAIDRAIIDIKDKRARGYVYRKRQMN